MSDYYETLEAVPEGSKSLRALAAHQDAQKRQWWAAATIADMLADGGEVDPWFIADYRKIRAVARYAAAVYAVEAQAVSS